MPEMKTIKFPGSDEIYEVTDAAAREALEKKLNADKLQEAVEAALEQAKTSGEFNGLTPHIGANGNWYIGDIDTGLPSRGEDGDDGFSPVVTVSKDGKLTTIKITTAQGDAYARIVDGSDGSPGVDGVSPTVSISKSGKVTTISIADKGGTKTATVNDGVDGSNGKDGTSVTVKSVSESTADGGSNVITFSDGQTLTVKNGTKGSAGADGRVPVKGTDYFTAADKAEMVNAVIAALPVYAGEVV